MDCPSEPKQHGSPLQSATGLFNELQPANYQAKAELSTNKFCRLKQAGNELLLNLNVSRHWDGLQLHQQEAATLIIYGEHKPCFCACFCGALMCDKHAIIVY